jgi:hypothetical protein
MDVKSNGKGIKEIHKGLIDNYDSQNAKKLTYVKERKNFVINKLHKKSKELQNLKDY